MISLKTAAAAAAALMLVGSSVALAADTKKKSTTPVVHSPESIECSKQADAKGLHGQERKKFRAECKKELEKNKTNATKKTDDKSTEKKS